MIKLDLNGKYFTNCDNAVHVEDSKVQQMIDEIEEKLLESKEYFDFRFQATGDTMVFGTKYGSEFEEEEIHIYVTQDYQEAELFKEDGKWTAIDWHEACLEDMTKEELIEEVRKLRAASYNPNKEY